MKAQPQVRIDGHSLDASALEKVARFGAQVTLAAEARRRISRSAKSLQGLMASDAPTYGVSTGLGALVGERVQASQASLSSRNLILSHAAGVGPPFESELVRAAMVIRLNAFAQGLSGIRQDLSDVLMALLNRGVTPQVPSQGSLGASGDLAPLAHLALAFSRGEHGVSPEATAWFEGELLPAEEALRRARIKPLKLGPKEGLSLTNGPAFSTALLALAWLDSGRLLAAAETGTAMALEALGAATPALDPRLHEARRHPGQIEVARRLKDLTRGSHLMDRTKVLQDPYCLRCAPQILGPVWETHVFVGHVIQRELNAATDNPLLFDGTAISGGNFHGAPLALAADQLKIALAQVGSLAERQIDRLVSPPAASGLPSMLVAAEGGAGLHSGLMMLQYTAASLCLENQALAGPDSVRSLPTSGGQEDINPNAATAGRHLRQMVANLRSILAIELLAAAQAFDLLGRSRESSRPGRAGRLAHAAIRARVPFLLGDAPLAPHIESLSKMLSDSEWLEPRKASPER